MRTLKSNIFRNSRSNVSVLTLVAYINKTFITFYVYLFRAVRGHQTSNGHKRTFFWITKIRPFPFSFMPDINHRNKKLPSCSICLYMYTTAFELHIQYRKWKYTYAIATFAAVRTVFLSGTYNHSIFYFQSWLLSNVLSISINR